MASLFEEMGGTYTLGADGMYYPNLELPEEETPRYGKYGRMRHTYLREHKKAYYATLLFDGKLVAHLNEIDDAANAQMELNISDIKVQKEEVSEVRYFSKDELLKRISNNYDGLTEKTGPWNFLKKILERYV